MLEDRRRHADAGRFPRLVALLMLLAGCAPRSGRSRADSAARERTRFRRSGARGRRAPASLRFRARRRRRRSRGRRAGSPVRLPRRRDRLGARARAAISEGARDRFPRPRRNGARRLILRECARSADPDERDRGPGGALTGGRRRRVAAGRPRSPRRAPRSLAGGARRGGRNLGPLRPTDALKTALARARRRARASRSRRRSEMRWMPRRSGSWARAARFAPPLWSRPSECSATRASRRFRVRTADAPQSRSRACDVSAEAAAALHSAAACAIAEDAARERELTRWLASRLKRRGPGAPGAAVALGALGGRDATAALAEALRDADGLLIKTVSASLATALRTSPEREPEDPIEIRRLWFPILATLVRED